MENSYQKMLLGPKLTSDIDLVMQTPNGSVAQQTYLLHINNEITEQAQIEMQQELEAAQARLNQQQEAIQRAQEEVEQADLQADKARLIENLKANEEARRELEQKTQQQERSLTSFTESMRQDAAMMSIISDYNADVEKANQILKESSDEIKAMTAQLKEDGQMPSDFRDIDLDSAIEKAVAERAHVLSKDDFRDMISRSQQQAAEMGLVDGPEPAAVQVDDAKQFFASMSSDEQTTFLQVVAPKADPKVDEAIDAKYQAHDSIHFLRQLENSAGNEDHVIRPSMAKQLAQAKLTTTDGEQKSYLNSVSSQIGNGRTAYQEQMAAADTKLRANISEAVRNGTLSEGYVAQFGDLENMKHEDLQNITSVLESRLNENRVEQLDLQTEVTELTDSVHELDDKLQQDEQSLEATQRQTLEVQAPELEQQSPDIQPDAPDVDEPNSTFNPAPGGMSGPGR